jgi:uncharacterized protein
MTLISPLNHLVAACILALTCIAAQADGLRDATVAIGRKDYAAAVRLLEPLAKAGNAGAQARLAQLYYHGQGVAESNEQARAWFERAARQSQAESQYQLGNMYAYGHAAPPPGEEAMRMAAQWYFAAARQGHADAQYSLGILFLVGSGVTASPTEARKWFSRAAAQGHGDARSYLQTSPAR